MQDYIEQNGEPLRATCDIKVGADDDYYVLPVYRPTLQKEICIDGKVVSYQEGTVVLPYILKQEVTLRDFSKDGFRSYECKQLTGLHDIIRHDSDLNVYTFWEEGYAIDAALLDATAPECLHLSLGSPDVQDESALSFYQWDYDKDAEPWLADYNNVPDKNTIIFQSMEHLSTGLTCLPTKRKNYPYTYRSVVVKKMNLLNCFETAMKHRLYFFVMEPVTQQKDITVWRTEVYEPLLAKRGGKLTAHDIMGLQRLAEERDFEWQSLGIELNQ